MNISIIKIYVCVVTVIAIVAMTKCSTNYSADEEYLCELRTAVIEKEAHLDSLAQLFPFDDTVAEGDDYQELRDAHRAFTETDDVTIAQSHYDHYCTFYNRIVRECMRLIQKKAIDEYVDNLPMHYCTTTTVKYVPER